MNRRSVALYSQNHPAEPSIDRIAADIHQYGHQQLHLTGHVRKGNPQLSFANLVRAIRRTAGLPGLDIPESSGDPHKDKKY